MQHFLYENNELEQKKRSNTLNRLDNEQWFYLKGEFPLLQSQIKEEEKIFLLTEEEKMLEAEMGKLREDYRKQNEDSQDPFIAERPFYDIKTKIEDSSLFKNVFRPMPKGGLLHIHSSAALSLESFKKMLIEWDGCYPSNSDITKCVGKSIFVVTEDFPLAEGGSIPKCSLYYLNSIKTMMATNPTLKEVIQPICNYLLSEDLWNVLCDMLAFCSSRTEKSNYIWDELNLMFIRIDNLFLDKEFYTKYHKCFFEECVDDNIEYVELRSGYAAFTDMNASDAARLGVEHLTVLCSEYSYKKHFYFKEMLMDLDYNKPEFLDAILDALDAANKEKHSNLSVKIILNVRRDLNPKEEKDNQKIISRLDYAIRYHRDKKNFEKYNQYVIGFDFVSEEDRGRPTSEYLQYIYGNMSTDIEDIGKQPRINLIDFYLHDGESNWNDNHNIVDAVNVSKYRIGHGFNMGKHPGVVNNLVFTESETNYARCFQTTFPFLEICLISNQLLGYCSDLRNHYAYVLMKSGVQCVLGNDDPFMFGNSGLSYDFWMAYVGMNLDFSSIKRLVYNSIVPLDYETSTANTEFDKKWEEFVNTALNQLMSKM